MGRVAHLLPGAPLVGGAEGAVQPPHEPLEAGSHPACSAGGYSDRSPISWMPAPPHGSMLE